MFLRFEEVSFTSISNLEDKGLKFSIDALFKISINSTNVLLSLL